VPFRELNLRSWKAVEPTDGRGGGHHAECLGNSWLERALEEAEVFCSEVELYLRPDPTSSTVQLMKGFLVRRVPGASVGAAKAVARRQAEQLTLVRRRAQPTAVYIARLTLTAVFAYLLALQLPGASSRDVLAPLTALLVVQATLFHTIRSAVQRVVGVTAGVLAAVAVSAYVPFSWWVLGLLIAGALAVGLILRLREDILEVPISAMLIFSVDSHAAATSRITETLVGAAAGLAAGLVFAPLRVQPARTAVGELSRQMADLLGQMADGLTFAEAPEPKRATEWLERTRALRGEIERVDEALGQAEESVRLNPRRLRFTDPAAGLRRGVDTLERAAIDIRVLARSVADSVRIDSEHSPVREAGTRARLAAVLAELSAAVRAYGQLLEAEPVSGEDAGHVGLADRAGLAGLAGRGLAGLAGRGGRSDFAAEPLTEVLEDHLAEARRQQDQLADLLSTDPAEQPEGWPLRGTILAHVDRLRSEIQAGQLPGQVGHQDRAQARVRQPLQALRDRRRDARAPRGRANRTALRGRARRTAARVRAARVRAGRVRAGRVRAGRVRAGRVRAGRGR
jgi:uncharacterized membrane protein YgaE (UPF0421/DUF939 family)